MENQHLNHSTTHSQIQMNTVKVARKRREQQLKNFAFREVSYNDAKYVVCTIQCGARDVDFLVDAEEFEKVIQYDWHVVTKKYIGTNAKDENGGHREMYLHNLILNRPLDNTTTVEHINRNGFDNRKINLRICTQSEQNMSTLGKRRNVVLPTGCGVKVEEIPKHVWYVKAYGQHGDRFAIEFRTENVLWKSTSSKRVDLQEKLQDAREKLQELYEIYPHLDPKYEEARIKALTESFQAIMECSLNEFQEQEK